VRPGQARIPVQSAPERNADYRPQGLPRWLHVARKLVGVLFCAEIGLFLLVYPWLTHWDQNFLSGFGERWYGVWTNEFFRGAVSGVGMLNLYISFWDLLELVRSFRGKPGRAGSHPLE